VFSVFAVCFRVLHCARCIYVAGYQWRQRIHVILHLFSDAKEKKDQQCVAVCCCVLQCVAVWCIVCCSVFQCFAVCWVYICVGTLKSDQGSISSGTCSRTATHSHTQPHTATHCNMLQHTATHFNTLQDTARYCNPLQHISD